MHACERRLGLVGHLRREEDALEPGFGRGVFGVELSTQQEKAAGQEEFEFRHGYNLFFLRGIGFQHVTTIRIVYLCWLVLLHDRLEAYPTVIPFSQYFDTAAIRSWQNT
jgi:hypothetical protein